MYISCKFNEIFYPILKDCIEISDGAYTKDDLLNIEKTESDVHEIFTRQIEEKREYDKKIMTAKNLFICLLILSIVTMIIMLVILFKNSFALSFTWSNKEKHCSYLFSECY